MSDFIEYLHEMFARFGNITTRRMFGAQRITYLMTANSPPPGHKARMRLPCALKKPKNAMRLRRHGAKHKLSYSSPLFGNN